MKLERKVALITGGSRGFGKGFAQEILEHGGMVSLLDILVDRGLETASEFNDTFGPGSALFIKCDVTKKEEFENAFRKTKEVFGHIDIVVNNAGISGNGKDLDDPKWKRVIDIDLSAVVQGTILAKEYMSVDNGGTGGLLVNIASTAGLTAVPWESVYAAAKHGVVGLSRSIAPTFESLGIRVACICPSFAKTDMVLNTLNHFGASSDNLPSFITDVGLLEISDVVKAFRHVVDRDEITGSVIAVTPKGIDYKFPRRLKGKL